MTAIRILVTGSRFLDDTGRTFVWSVLDQLFAEIDTTQGRGRDAVIVQGGAAGVDDAALTWARRPGVTPETHRADWSGGNSAGPRRNAAMVALGAHLCLAFPRRDSKGTWGCIRMAADAGIPVRIHPLPKMTGLIGS